jgi:putative FmdB family regulatory protein
MPTYGYKCPGCGHEFEKFQKITDDARARCPKCKKRAERVISGGAGVVFKGSGFYETDYKRAKPADKPKSKEESSTSDKSSEKSRTEDQSTKPSKGDES